MRNGSQITQEHSIQEQNEVQEHIIRWNRLVRICKGITNKKEVNINLTTMQTDLRAGVIFNSNSANIVINGGLCKRESDIIEALAHEITHVVDNGQQHDNMFYERMEEIRSRIVAAYTN
jgi:hypothetical protein